MIVYRNVSRDEPTGEKVSRLLRSAERGDATAFLVEAGELEQGVLDALRPHRDDWGPVERLLRRALREAGAAYVAARSGAAPAPHLRRAGEALERLRASAELPRRIGVKPPEGYAHYALDPAGYAAAAAGHRGEVGEARAARTVVLGVRSIGTSLSAVVAAALGSDRTATLRPRGETGARRVAAARCLRELLAGWLRDGADVAVVDEGPGATGETLWAVAEWLRGLGVDDARLILFASRAWGMPLAPEARRRWFETARKRVPPPGDPRPVRIAEMLGLGTLEDLSAGRWRERLPGAAAEPACVGHERCKYLARDERGRAYLLRYVGLGEWGDAVARRAVALAEIGAGPRVVACSDGFLVLRWLEGRPLRRREARDAAFLRALEAYLRARAGRFRTGEAVSQAAMVELLLANAGEALGPAAAGLAAAARRLERLPPREAVVPDARLQRREWLRTAAGYRKVDALDHGDGLRFPGPTDPAWDLAGAAVEFELDDGVVDDLVRRRADAIGEAPGLLAEAVAAYRAPYAANGLGDALLSAREAAAEADRRRLAAEAARYRGALARELRRAA